MERLRPLADMVGLSRASSRTRRSRRRATAGGDDRLLLGAQPPLGRGPAIQAAIAPAVAFFAVGRRANGNGQAAVTANGNGHAPEPAHAP